MSIAADKYNKKLKEYLETQNTGDIKRIEIDDESGSDSHLRIRLVFENQSIEIEVSYLYSIALGIKS